MKKNELADALKKAGIASMLYNLESTGRRDERFCLEYSDNAWTVYYSERGVRTTNEQFASEEEACQFLFAQLCPL